MDWANIIIPACASIGTVIAVVSIVMGQFDKIFKEINEIKMNIRQLDSRLSRIEGYIQNRDHK